MNFRKPARGAAVLLVPESVPESCRLVFPHYSCHHSLSCSVVCQRNTARHLPNANQRTLCQSASSHSIYPAVQPGIPVGICEEFSGGNRLRGIERHEAD